MMLRKADYHGSIRTLTDEQLRRLLTSANYRGLTGVAQAIRREQVRRITPWGEDVHPVDALQDTVRGMGYELNPEQFAALRAHCDEPVEMPPVDYTPPQRYDYDGYAGCRA